jgi:UDP-glucose 4-epimerase
MKNVAITGISGYIGSQLLHKLEQQEEVERIVGIDVNPPKSDSPKVKFYSRDIRAPFKDILEENQIDTAVHLAFVVTPTRNTSGARDININGSRNFLDSCAQAGVEQVLYLSSHTVYGPHPDNPIPIKEDTPLRPPRNFPYPCEKAEVEQMFGEFVEQHPDICVTIFRACAIVGPKAGVAGINVLFTPIMMRPLGYNAPWQFIYEDELMEAFYRVLSQRRKGIYNIGGDGYVPYKEMIAAAGKPCVVLPAGLLKLIVTLTWKLHLQSRSPAGVEFMQYPIVVDASKLQETIGYRFQHSSREALMSLLGSAKGAS